MRRFTRVTRPSSVGDEVEVLGRVRDVRQPARRLFVPARTVARDRHEHSECLAGLRQSVTRQQDSRTLAVCRTS
jgi:hypothetical protein